ncbi:hypothetical protein [Erwinia persicina]|uniref:hypothetical protein n=1 Tax=Erwinia persicina TaxID=55211 RepID=UPI0017864C20|nr:hypothetical protein [Erwinia persicina]MBD8213037.1 hypothetical protein [Erwinia persicina]
MKIFIASGLALLLPEAILTAGIVAGSVNGADYTTRCIPGIFLPAVHFCFSPTSYLLSPTTALLAEGYHAGKNDQ